MVHVTAAPILPADWKTAHSHGWRFLGAGFSKSVLCPPHKKFVVLCQKGSINSVEDKLLHAWVALCRKTANPHLPRFLSGVRYGETDTGYPVSMVQCELLDSAPAASQWLAPLEVLYELSPSQRKGIRSWAALVEAIDTDSRYASTPLRALLRVLSQPEHVKLTQALTLILRQAPSSALIDFSSGNVLRRGSTVVLIDPWAPSQ